jgi:ubiquinone/menaquinone biosynthesis C-methylase UbiE
MEIALSLARSKTYWNDMGRLDPCWAILSRPDKRFGRWDFGEFFDTGETEIAKLMEEMSRIGLPTSRMRALDFGCGVGRLTQPLARYFEESIGLDISDSMVARAKELSHLPNCRFVLSDQATLPFPAGHFDLIYTSIVLQHVPSKDLIRGYIAEFMRTLNKGGLLVMQLPSHIPLHHRLQPKRRLYQGLRELGVSESFLFKTLKLHPILMNFLPTSDVYSTVKAGGGRILFSRPDDKSSDGSESSTYYVTR